ncbi:MAG: hypothetical protein E6772_13640 [Dysgonomonas sp.]|nr:hypothetical protein [Dysgonomonas sp.]
MEKDEHKKDHEEFIAYEEARIDKEEETPIEATDCEVNAATDIINLDEETRERG